MDKVEYYMVHEKERLEIAENGYRKVKMEHTYKQRVDNILENSLLISIQIHLKLMRQGIQYCFAL